MNEAEEFMTKDEAKNKLDGIRKDAADKLDGFALMMIEAHGYDVNATKVALSAAMIGCAAALCASVFNIDAKELKAAFFQHLGEMAKAALAVAGDKS